MIPLDVVVPDVAMLVPLQVCPVAPPGAQQYADQLTGYVLWAVLALFVVGIVVSIGGIVLGRALSMPHASKAGVIGIFVVFVAAVLYTVVPSMVSSVTGAGCVG